MKNNLLQKKFGILATVAALSLSGCGDDSDESATDQSGQTASALSVAAQSTTNAAGKATQSAQRSPLLAYIPADTPYFATNSQAMPAVVTDLAWTSFEAMLVGAEQALAEWERTLEESKGPSSATDSANADTEQEKLSTALRDTFRGKLNRQGLAELGFEPEDYYAFYGLGVLPVMRLTISDPERLKSTIESIAQRAGLDFGQQTLGGFDYYLIGDAPGEPGSSIKINDEHGDEIELSSAAGRLLAAIGNGQLVFSILPASADDNLLPQILGVDKPARSLAESPLIGELNREFELGPYGTALFDTVALTEHVLEGDSALANTLFSELRDNLSPVCRNEFLDLAAIAPRFVTGYGEITQDRIQSLAVVDLRDDIAAGLAQLTLPIAAATPGDLISVSGGFDLLKGKQFLKDRVAAIKAAPFACELLADMNDTADAEQALEQPLPPFVTNIKGFRLSATEVDFNADGDPTSGKGLAMLAIDNPQFVLGMAQMFVPELANLQVPADGTPVELPLAALATVGAPPVHVAMTDAGLGFAIGEGEQAKLAAFLNAPTAPAGTALSFVYDMKALMSLQMTEARAELAKLDSAEQEFFGKVLDQVEQSLANLDEVSGHVMFTARGVELDSTTTLLR